MMMDKHDTTPRTTAGVAPGAPAPERKRSGLWLGLVALLPIACCGLPLLLAAGITAGTGAAVGGAAGLGLLLAAAVLAFVTLRRRRSAACRTDIGAASAPGKGSCC